MRIEEVGGGLKDFFFLGSKACHYEIRTAVFLEGGLMEKHTEVGLVCLYVSLPMLAL